MTKLNNSLRAALTEVAKAEIAGRTIGGRDIGTRLGAGQSTGQEWRSKLLALGLVATAGKIGCTSRLRLTDAGWEVLGGKAAVKPDTGAAKQRACMCCGSTFPSEGPGHRLCNACCTKSGDDTYRMLPR